MHHVLDDLPVQPGLLLVQAPDLLVALPRGQHRPVQPLVVPATVLLHGLAQPSEALADVAELPLVVVLALGRLVARHLGHVPHRAVELCAELTEGLYLSIPETWKHNVMQALQFTGFL